MRRNRPQLRLTDAIAATFCWPILGQFFERTLYPSLTIETDTSGLTLRRGDCRLASGLAIDAPFSWQEMHDRIGWTVFLQEVWGCPERPIGWFYQDRPDGPAEDQRLATGSTGDLEPPQTAPSRRCGAEMAPRRRMDGGWLAIEISDELPDIIEANGQDLMSC